MAGSYPDVPGRRMPWDADGTIFGAILGGTGSPSPGIFDEATSSERAEINDEDDVNAAFSAFGTGGTPGHYVALFPELREVDGFFARLISTGSEGDVETSGDTTNGIDGTWTARIANYTPGSINVLTGGEYRDDITSLAVSNVRGIRMEVASGQSLRAFHLYGEIAAGETPDRLLWVDNDTGSEFGLPIDYGDIPRGSAEDREVLLRNNSGSLTAASVQITAEALFQDSGSWYTAKEAGGSFQATLPLSSSIGAGSDSPVLTIRRITPDDETLGLHAGRAVASVGSWS